MRLPQPLGQLGHGDIGCCLDPPDQLRPDTCKLAAAGPAAPLTRPCRTGRRHPPQQLDRTTRAHPKPRCRRTPGRTGLHCRNKPKTQVHRDDLRHGSASSHGRIRQPVTGASDSYIRPTALVAPRAGAWIETRRDFRDGLAPVVAPRAGAWIETALGTRSPRPAVSLPVRGRGSKLMPRRRDVLQGGRSPCGGVDRNSASAANRCTSCVAPRAGAWIETTATRRGRLNGSSLPVRGRGSKLADVEVIERGRQSLPARARGSKLGRLGLGGQPVGGPQTRPAAPAPPLPR